MTCKEKLDEIYSLYSKVALLSDKNGCSVIRIRHKELGRDLVLHVLPTQNKVYDILCAIRCDNLPQIYEVYSLSDGMIVLEEFIDGMSIFQISETGRIKKKGAVRIVKQLCSALFVLHENGIIHRDIKPENVIVDNSGVAKLIDFNASRVMSIKSRDTTVMGTVGYAAPEQLGLSQSDPRADVYALGILLNVMITGTHPTEKLAFGYIRHIIRKCTSLNLNDRYQTVKQLQRALIFA